MFYRPNTSFSLRENDGIITADQHIVTASLLIALKLITAKKFMGLVGLEESISGVHHSSFITRK